MTPCRFTQQRSAPSRLDAGLRRRVREMVHLAGLPPDTVCTIHLMQTPWFPHKTAVYEVPPLPAEAERSRSNGLLQRLREAWQRLRTRWSC